MKADSRETLSFPKLVAIFAYFSLVTMGMAIFWETSIWFQSHLLAELGNVCAGILVVSLITASGIFVYFWTKNHQPAQAKV
jgi:hypothetical protein